MDSGPSMDEKVGLPDVTVPGVASRGAAGRGAAGAGATAVPMHSRGRPGPFRVVIADDADGLRELLCLLFDTEPDFTVVGWAANGADAVEVVSRTAPDLVLLDVAMPVLDGIGALPRVRTAVPDARVVIFTGFSETALREEVLALGADELLEKGVSTAVLVDQLRRICRQPRPA